MYATLIRFAAVATALATHGAATALPISYTDLWDTSQGSVVDTTTGALYYRSSYFFDIDDMFGARNDKALGPGVTLFKDYMQPGLQGGSVPAGYVHSVDWHTRSPVTLRSFSLHAQNEGMPRRAFNRFTLYAATTAGGTWSTLYDTGAGFTYDGSLVLDSNVAETTARYFRAEFVQAPWNDRRAVGPRVVELDGFATFLPGTTPPPSMPEPGTLALMGGVLAALGLARRRG